MEWGDFGLGIFVGVLIGSIVTVISIAFGQVERGTITIEPVKDEYRNEILYYTDIYTNNRYEKVNNILYYIDEELLEEGEVNE